MATRPSITMHFKNPIFTLLFTLLMGASASGSLARNAPGSAAAAQTAALPAAPTATPAAAPPVDGTLTPIASLDVSRYMGVWYEIAKYPNWFQRGCLANTKAEYQPQPNGSVKVINRCTSDDGKTKEAVGTARQIGAPTSPKLQVQFTPAWLSFIPFLWADYWVIDLDADYQLAAVSEPKKEYLWVLSRTPEVNPAAYAALLARLKVKGFDLQKLERTRQAN